MFKSWQTILLGVATSIVAGWITTLVPLPILVDFVTGLDIDSPVGESLIQITIASVALFAAFTLVVQAYRWGIDRLKKGPQSREFIALSDRIARSKTNLLELEKGRLPNESENEYGSRALGILNEVLSLGFELARLRILIPPFIDSDFNNMTIWIVFLTNLEGMARRGDYKIAVDFSMALHRQFFETSENKGPA